MAKKTTKAGRAKVTPQSHAQLTRDAMGKPPWFFDVFQAIITDMVAVCGDTGYQLPPYVPSEQTRPTSTAWHGSILDFVQVPHDLAEEINSLLAKGGHQLGAEQIAGLFYLCETHLELDKEYRWPFPKPPEPLSAYTLTEASHRELAYATQCITSVVDRLDQHMEHVKMLQTMLRAQMKFIYVCKRDPSRRRPPKPYKVVADQIVAILRGDADAANRWGIKPVAPPVVSKDSPDLALNIASVLLKHFGIDKAPSQLESRAEGKVLRR